MASLLAAPALAHGCSTGVADSAGRGLVAEDPADPAGTKGSPYELSGAAAARSVFELECGLNSTEAVQEQDFGCV